VAHYEGGTALVPRAAGWRIPGSIPGIHRPATREPCQPLSVLPGHVGSIEAAHWASPSVSLTWPLPSLPLYRPVCREPTRGCEGRPLGPNLQAGSSRVRRFRGGNDGPGSRQRPASQVERSVLLIPAAPEGTRCPGFGLVRGDLRTPKVFGGPGLPAWREP
jgi:hypothetical protein